MELGRELEPPKRKGKCVTLQPRGLWNAGQSCHLGASVTALSASRSLRRWVERHEVSSQAQATFAHKLKLYLLDAASSCQRHGLDPRPILRPLEATGWKSRHAQDAHDTMSRLLDVMQGWNKGGYIEIPPSLNVVLKSSQSSSLCHGRIECVKSWHTKKVAPFTMLTSSRKFCNACGYRSPMKIDSTNIGILPAFEEPRRLDRIFSEYYYSRENIEMRCDECNYHGTQQLTWDIKKLPEVLILYLPRAVYLSGLSRSNGRVVFSDRFRTNEGFFNQIRGNYCDYRLRAVVKHHGAASGYSHFTSIVKQVSRLAKKKNGQGANLWWLVDDDDVYPTTREFACDPTNAYMLIFDLVSNY